MENIPVELRAGGVVVRKNNGQIEYLLITSVSRPDRWIFPSGHVEKGETFEATALREVLEEAGVEAEIICSLGSMRYQWPQEQGRITIDNHLFLMKYLKAVNPIPEGRQVAFYRIEQISSLNLWDETRTFLENIHKAVNSSI
ncbi:MAG: NUDIX domain-containing protein [Firmicutes bacterium]|nr:NUDIX domain-containing protein [Bacillota bacterium]